MIERTFCHLPGIGLKKEKYLWDRGIHSWNCFLEHARSKKIPNFYQKLIPLLNASIQELQAGNASFFAGHLPKSEQWRLFGEFQDNTAYIDIETTGQGPDFDHITSIALFDGKNLQTFVHGKNLEEFADSILKYKIIVTYNGSCFDLPFIQKELGIELPQAHIDLRFVLASLGYRGGLKKCEKYFGLDRGELDGMDGYLAVLLWQEYENSGDQSALETLLAYNAEDVLSLQVLLKHAYNLKLHSLPFGQNLILENIFPQPNPYRTFPHILDRLRQFFPGIA